MFLQRRIKSIYASFQKEIMTSFVGNELFGMLGEHFILKDASFRRSNFDLIHKNGFSYLKRFHFKSMII